MVAGEWGDVVQRLRQLSDWVDSDQGAAPELRIFEDAAVEIERLRRRLDRINQVANGALVS